MFCFIYKKFHNKKIYIVEMFINKSILETQETTKHKKITIKKCVSFDFKLETKFWFIIKKPIKYFDFE